MRKASADDHGPWITAPWADDQTPSTHAVRQSLAGLDDTDLADLHIVLDGGRATIDGSVLRASDRDRIVRAIVALPGVSSVIDRLRLRT